MESRAATWKIERILAGIEREGRSEPGRIQAMELADLFGAELELVHAVPTGEPIRGIGRSAHWAAAAQRALAESRADVEGRLSLAVEHPRWAELPTEDYLRVIPGKPAHVLLERAREFQASLIVFGPHRRHGLLDLGGTARAVLGHAGVPIWLQPCAPRKIQRLLVPLDLSDASQGVMFVARSMAEKLGASVTCLHAFPIPVFAFNAMETAIDGPTYVIDDHRKDEFGQFDELVSNFDWQGVPVERTKVDGDPIDTIVGHEGDDLIVMGTHGHTGLGRVLGSIADGVLRRAERPVLCVP